MLSGDIAVIGGGPAGLMAAEVAASAGSAALDRAFYTPQSVAMQPLAAAYGWAYRRAETGAALDDALAAEVDGPQLIEVPLPR